MKTPSLKTLIRRHSIWAVCAAAINLLALPELRAATFVSQQAYLKASNTEAFDFFGAVAVSGDTLVVGASSEDSNATGVNGNQLDNKGTNSGAVYVFVRQGDSWTQQAYLKASNTGLEDLFGFAVALSGDTLVVGAVQEDSASRGVNGDQSGNTGTNSGAVYVFERTGTNWVQQAYLKLSNTEFGEAFGRSVAISGDTIVVGARIESSAASGVNGDQFNNDMPAAGAAYVFVRTGTNWSQQAYLKASNPDINDLFGNSVAVSGDTIAVGAVFEDSNATGVNGNQSNNSMTNSGAVYIFVRSGTNWAQEAYLKASNPGSTNYSSSSFVTGDEFGYSLNLYGNMLVVGARNESSNASGVNGNESDNSLRSAGAAYVFVRAGSSWAQQAYLKPSNTRNIQNFGEAVAAVTENQVLIGAGSDWSNATGVNGNQDDTSAVQSGAAYLFNRSGTDWSQVAYLKASNTEARDVFGRAVAGSGDTLLIGASGEDSRATGINGDQSDNSAESAGAAYVFTVVEPGPPAISSDPRSRTNLATTKATFAVEATGSRPFQYQWRKNGVNLTDAENIFGAQSSLLSVSQALHADEGPYDVIVSNASGSVTSLVATLTVTEPVIFGRSARPWPTVGDRFELGVEAAGTPPFNYEWRRNGTVVPGATRATLTIQQAQLSDAGEYRVTVANAFGSATATFEVSVNAAVVDSFNPELLSAPGNIPLIGALAVQTDGRIVVGGFFEEAAGFSSSALMRLHPDGSPDDSLYSGIPSFSQVNAVALLPDGKILASSYSYNTPPTFLYRYLPSGSADPSFAQPPDLWGPPEQMVAQPNGNVVFVFGFPFFQVRRLKPDGTSDANFQIVGNEIPRSLAAQRDGKILIGGLVNQLGTQSVRGLGRLNANGTPDAAFHPEFSLDGDWTQAWVDAIAVQEDGKIIVTGLFDQLAGKSRPGIGRLNPDGTADPEFHAALPFRNFGNVSSIALQADGKILLGGSFTSLNGQPIARIGRLNSDGSLDTTFNPGADGPVLGLTVQPDGRVLVGGAFSVLGGQARQGLGRLVNTTPATQTLSYDGSTVRWLRGGASPAVWTVLFERSTDGTSWTSLGAGTRIDGGWQLLGVTAAVGTKLRARGWVASGGGSSVGASGGGSSGWFTESVLTVPMQLLTGSLQTQPFRFNVRGAAGQSIVIEGSMDFQQWIPLKTNVVPANGLVPFTDPGTAQFPHRFYRGRNQ